MQPSPTQSNGTYKWFQVKTSKELFAPTLIHGTPYQCRLLMKRELNPKWVMVGTHSAPDSLAPNNIKIVGDAVQLRIEEIASAVLYAENSRTFGHMTYTEWRTGIESGRFHNPQIIYTTVERSEILRKAAPYMSCHDRWSFEMLCNDMLKALPEHIEEAAFQWESSGNTVDWHVFKHCWALVEASKTPTTLEEYDIVKLIKKTVGEGAPRQ